MTTCRYKIGDKVQWQGQDGRKSGTVTRITRPENSSYVLRIINAELDDFALGEDDVEPAGMSEPSTEFLVIFGEALESAEHKNVAQHMAAGVLWAMYPEWFDTVYKPFALKRKRGTDDTDWYERMPGEPHP